ncbi:phosphatase PAP2 family protein [Mucilaginibacter robiniae]|uniref:Phosphatase PAP2 family protein n=1 Tax=Mucilaginibacter robiniae TaxID=2728022 RepID=A0A7L5E599_9SPHI|nr:phosphatase PAP2 family protein [Mucilaginibacter robiniae]QJD96013.1 phosphatase PAP2 family protein [Mucilaginibacter robiniae]
MISPKKISPKSAGLLCLFCISSSVVLATLFYNQDKTIVLFLNHLRNPTRDLFWLTVTNSAGIIAYGTSFIALIVSLFTKEKELKYKCMAIVAAAIFSATTATALKFIIQKPRPVRMLTTIHVLGPAGGWSYPSGHTSDAFFLAMALALTLPQYKKTVFLFYIWALLVGFSRIYLGAHYLSDVLGGIGVGSAMSLLAYRLIESVAKKHHALL